MEILAQQQAAETDNIWVTYVNLKTGKYSTHQSIGSHSASIWTSLSTRQAEKGCDLEAIKVTQKLASHNTLLTAVAKYEVIQLQLFAGFEPTTRHFVPVSLLSFKAK